MIKINLSPVRSDEEQLKVTWNDPVLTIDTVEYQLDELPDGATAHHPVLSTVERTGNDYECTLRLTHGADAPYNTRFPMPITVFADGPVELPVYNTPVIESEPEATV